jgi:PAT family beta-lactamase induction signal transducer AmpG
MTDKEIAALGLVSSLVFTVCCMTGGFLSDRFGRRLTLALFALGTLVPTLWMAWRLGGEGWTMPLPASADGSWPRQEVLIKAWWIAAIAYSVFNGLLYGIRTALFMDIVEPRIAATQFTACMALLNLVTIYCYWWQGKAVTPVADGGWGLSYQSIFLIDAALGTVFIFILPFLKPRNVEERAEVGVVGNEVI